MCKTQCVNGSASRTSRTDQLDRPSGRTIWTDICTDQLDGPAGWTSSLYLKPWPVCIFEDWRFSLYIVAASESDEGLFFYNEYPATVRVCLYLLQIIGYYIKGNRTLGLVKTLFLLYNGHKSLLFFCFCLLGSWYSKQQVSVQIYSNNYLNSERIQEETNLMAKQNKTFYGLFLILPSSV